MRPATREPGQVLCLLRPVVLTLNLTGMHMPDKRHPAGAARLLIPLLLVTAILLLTIFQVTAQEAAVPLAPPDAAAGLQVYAERCANCHGPLGNGDGELAARSAVPPVVFTDPEYIRQARPGLMFTTITNGIMGDNGPTMPPFGPSSSNPIDEATRWDLIAAVYSLATPADSLAAGQVVYEANCQSCHGESGTEAFDLTDQTYWANRSNQDVFTALQGDTIADHTYTLDEDALWQVVDYSRSFSYVYEDPQAAFAPLPAGTIAGSVLNGTQNAMLTTPISITLNAFSPDFQIALTQTTTLDDQGSFFFEVTDVAPDLVYVVTLDYQGVQFGSDFGSLSRSQPSLEIPVIVYDTTTDPAGVTIDQIHVILEFGEGQVVVNELYQFGNSSPTVYVGPTGNNREGTVQIALPAGAQNPVFQRTFGSLDNFLPVNNMIPLEDAWADTVPIRPGRASMSLLTRYSLPYEGETTIEHPVFYDLVNANLVLPDVGVALDDNGQWVSGGAQSLDGSNFLSYALSNLPAGSDLTIILNGEPTQVTDGSGNTIAAPRSQTNELLIGGGVLLIAAAVAIYFISNRRTAALAAAATVPPEPPAPPELPPGAPAPGRDEILLAIADLDDAYERGEITEEAYQARRQELKELLLAIWR